MVVKLNQSVAVFTIARYAVYTGEVGNPYACDTCLPSRVVKAAKKEGIKQAHEIAPEQHPVRCRVCGMSFDISPFLEAATISAAVTL